MPLPRSDGVGEAFVLFPTSTITSDVLPLQRFDGVGVAIVHPITPQPDWWPHNFPRIVVCPLPRCLGGRLIGGELG